MLKKIILFSATFLSISCLAFSIHNKTATAIHVTGDKNGYEETIISYHTSSKSSNLNKKIKLVVRWALVCPSTSAICPSIGTYISNSKATCELGPGKQLVVTGVCKGISVINHTVECTRGESIHLICPNV